MPALILVAALILLEVGRWFITGTTETALARAARQDTVLVRTGVGVAEAATILQVRNLRVSQRDPSSTPHLGGQFAWCPTRANNCGRTLYYDAWYLSETQNDAATGTAVTAANVNTAPTIAEVRTNYLLVSYLLDGAGRQVAVDQETLFVRSWKDGAAKVGAREFVAGRNNAGQGDLAGCAGNGCVANQSVPASDTRVIGIPQCQGDANWSCTNAPPNPDPNSYSNVPWHTGETPSW